MANPTPGELTTQILDMLDDIKTIASGLEISSALTTNNAAAYAQNQKGQAPSAVAFPFTPTVYEPNVNIPETASTDFTIIQIEPLINDMMDNLRDEFTRFFAAYFPDECDYMAKVQTWLCDVIDGGYDGIPINVETQIYQRDRDRIEAEYAKGVDEANNMWASRGFPLPPGMLMGQTTALRQAADKQLAESSRNVAIKQIDLQIDMIKFAVGTAADLRTKAIDAAARYIGALTTGLDVYSKAVVVQQDAQAKLISAASDFFRARIALEELKYKAEATEAELQDKAKQRAHEQFVELNKEAVSAVVDGARNLATQAAAALNALHTGAQMSVNVSA